MQSSYIRPIYSSILKICVEHVFLYLAVRIKLRAREIITGVRLALALYSFI